MTAKATINVFYVCPRLEKYHHDFDYFHQYTRWCKNNGATDIRSTCNNGGGWECVVFGVAALNQTSTLIEPSVPINPPRPFFGFGNDGNAVPGGIEKARGATAGVDAAFTDNGLTSALRSSSI
jgi:hypothetical protein